MAAPEFTRTSLPVTILLARNAAEWHGVFRRWGKRRAWPGPNLAACEVKVEFGVFMIALGVRFHEQPTAIKAGMLAHEATHVWQDVAHHCNIHAREWEFNAHTVQAIVQWAYEIVVDGAVN